MGVTSVPLGESEVTAAALPEPRQLGPFEVTTEAEAVTAFRSVTGWSAAQDDSRVPVTFAFCWLTLPAIRPALEALVPEPGWIPVHESQSFSYARPLAINETYLMSLEARREPKPDRLIVTAKITDRADAPCGEFETILRIIHIAPDQAA